jgi:hypothetical protein
MSKKITFEQFLKDLFGSTYQGTDDDMPDAFDSWVSKLDTEDIMKLAEVALQLAQSNHV